MVLGDMEGYCESKIAYRRQKCHRLIFCCDTTCYKLKIVISTKR